MVSFFQLTLLQLGGEKSLLKKQEEYQVECIFDLQSFSCHDHDRLIWDLNRCAVLLHFLVPKVLWPLSDFIFWGHFFIKCQLSSSLFSTFSWASSWAMYLIPLLVSPSQPYKLLAGWQECGEWGFWRVWSGVGWTNQSSRPDRCLFRRWLY